MHVRVRFLAVGVARLEHTGAQAHQGGRFVDGLAHGGWQQALLEVLGHNHVHFLAKVFFTVDQLAADAVVVDGGIDAAGADVLVAVDTPELVVDQAGVVVVAQLPGGEQGGGLQVAQLATECLTEAVHARAGAGEVGAVALKAGLLEVVRTVVATAAAATGIGRTDLPLRVQAQADAEVGGPGVDVAALLASGNLLVADGLAAESVAVTGQPGDAAPVVDGVVVAPVVGVAVGFQAQPGQVAGAGLVQCVDGFTRFFRLPLSWV